MNLILNIIVLIFEILYYSLFMKFARKEGKIWKYLIAFSISVIISGFLNVETFISYILTLICMLVSLKYIARLKVNLFDLLYIFIMMFFKIIIETLVFVIFNNLLPIFAFYIVLEFVKIFTIIILKDKFNKLYKILKLKWENNNFYIRYIFTTLMFAYTIISCLFIIFYYM